MNTNTEAGGVQLVTATNLLIYLAVKDADQRSHMEDSLVLDGFDVSSFPSAADLWRAFELKQAAVDVGLQHYHALGFV